MFCKRVLHPGYCTRVDHGRMAAVQGTGPVIGFIDIDSFECQLYQRDYPQLRGKPCVVSNTSQRIVAVSYEAKRLGISRNSTPFVQKAKRKCRDLHVFKKENKWGKQDSTKTRKATWEILDCIKEFCSQLGDDIIIELASSDELYLDLSSEVTRRMERRQGSTNELDVLRLPSTVVYESATGNSKQGPFDYQLRQAMRTMAANPPEYWNSVYQDEDRLAFGAIILDDICKYLVQKTELSASAGVSTNKLLAKVGCGINKPAKVTIFHRSAFLKYKSPILIKDIPGLGSETGDKIMEEFDISLVSELRARVSLSMLQQEFETEVAEKIFSCARGKDDRPVIQQYMRDGFTCNKPRGDVTMLTDLEFTLKNLCSEILERHEEEKSRHMRSANQVGFGFALVLQNGEKISANGNLDLTADECTYMDLNDEAMGLILGHSDFNRLEFRISELKMTLTDFMPLNSADDLGISLSKSLVLGPKKLLPVKNKSKQNHEVENILNRKHIGAFRTTMDGKYSTRVNIPSLVPLQSLKKCIGSNLGIGFENARATLIHDHSSYNELKHLCFIKWLQESKLSENIKTGIARKPDFVGFNGRFADTMRSAASKQYGDWEVLATNLGGIVYIWDEKNPKFGTSQQSYYGNRFERLATNNDGDTTQNENDMIYVVNEMTLGHHQLLVVSNIDAVDSSANGTHSGWTEITVRKSNKNNPNAIFGMRLYLWSQCMMSGAQRILLGSRSDAGVLESIEMKSIEDITELLDDNSAKCLNFQNRFLSFIKAHLPESNRHVVKKFSWICGNSNVVCKEMPQQEIPNLIFSRLYTPYFNDLQNKGYL